MVSGLRNRMLQKILIFWSSGSETLPICGMELLQLEFTKAYCAYCATNGRSPISFQTCFPTAQKQWMIITHQGASPVCWYKCPWISWSWRLTKTEKKQRPSRNPNCSDCINCLLKKWKTLGGLRFEAYKWVLPYAVVFQGLPQLAHSF